MERDIIVINMSSNKRDYVEPRSCILMQIMHELP